MSTKNYKREEVWLMGKRFQSLMARLIIAVFILGMFPSVPAPAQAADTVGLVEYQVLEDAYVRKSRGTSNFNFENITKAHGAQYENKGYTVINAKYDSGDEIISAMKFKLPTKQEIEEKKLNRFDFVFSIFKNANFTSGDQSYIFHYSTNTDWSETSLTWNNKPAFMDRNDTNLLFQFDIKQNDEYETKPEEEKTITTNITDKIIELVNEGHEQITIFTTAKNSLNTSILIHSKETSDETKKAKIVGSSKEYTMDMLNGLVQQYESVDPSDYTQDSFAIFKEKLDVAKALLKQAEVTDIEIQNAYIALKEAYQGLVSTVDPNDPDNIAYQKPTRSNLSKTLAKNVTDGDLNTTWNGVFYPSYVDIDLMQQFDLREIKLYLPPGKVTYYTIYGSNDGENFDRLHQKRTKTAATEAGDTIVFDKPSSYRIVRVYMEYTQGDNKAYLSEVKVYGTKTDTNTQPLRTGTLEEVLGVKDFKETAYNKEITNQEIYENIYGIVGRTVGEEYRDWFSFEVKPNTENGNDYFELSDKDGKVHIKGNEGVSITTGLNYYYKNYLNVQISEQTMQVNMPDKIVKIGDTVRKETPHKIRYAYNYCTLSYSFAFFGVEDWQRENDWLALNGVNVVLDLAGQEATWIKFLMNFGYSFDDAKDWLTGPAYYAWQFMDNMESFGGPVPDGYVTDRVELARSTQRWKNSLGMQTVLQGYAGMVPTNFNEFQPDVEVVKQGGWNGFTRPDMIATDSDLYDQYAKLFYEAQEFVYGDTTDYYAVDPFHEGGKRPAGLGDATIADEVLNSMLDYDKEAVWIVQGWQSNPTNALLNGMGDRREDHVLIVDLIKYPIAGSTKYNKTSYGSTKLDAVEFNGTSWVWGLLANFGGNPSMHGQMEEMVDDIQNAKKTSKHMAGLGIISEAQYDNPIIYDLIFDLAWADEDFNLDQWMNKYIERRYGGTSENAKLAWKIMKDSNYDYGVRFTTQVFGMKNTTPQSYGKQDISYGAEKLEAAFRLLIEDYDKFKNSEAYRYDLTEIMRQLVSNYAVLSYNDLLTAKEGRDLEAFKEEKQKYLKAFDVLNAVQATQKDQLAGEWIGKAQDLAVPYDDFSEDAFEMNAKALITTWGSRQSHGSLKEYGWRNYEGMFMDLYKNVWKEYLDKVEANLETGAAINAISVTGYFDLYWDWVLGEQNYTRDAKDSAAEMQEVINLVLENCMLSGEIDPNIGNRALNRVVSTNAKAVLGKLSTITDGKEDTKASIKATNDRTEPEMIVDLIGEFQLSKIQVLVDRSTFDGYDVYVSSDKKTWNKVGELTASQITNPMDEFLVSDLIGRYVKIKAVSASTKNISDKELIIKEIRAYGEPILPTLEQLSSLVGYGKTINLDASEQGDIDRFTMALQNAENAIANGAAVDEVNGVYWNLYETIVKLNLTGVKNLALHKPVTAHNDPSGYSERMVDDSKGTVWNSGRLSVTGKPYEATITPGWAIIELDKVSNIEEIRVIFGNNNQRYWHNYELYGSLDGTTWTKIGEKTTRTTPNEAEDFHILENVTASYIKIVTTNIQEDSSNRRAGYEIAELQVLGTEVVIDKDELNAVLAEADALDLTKYTESTVKALTDVLAAAKTVADNPDAAQTQVDNAVTAVKEAIGNLQLLADKSELTAVLAEANDVDQGKYTESTVKALTDAVAAAQTVADKPDATQTEVNQAVKAVKVALANLELLVDKSELTAVLAEANGIDKSKYTESTVKALTDAIVAAKIVADNPESTQEDVNHAVKAVKDAIKALGLIVNESTNPIVPEKPKAVISPNNSGQTLPNTGAIVSAPALLVIGALVIVAGVIFRRRYSVKNN
jgi:LPXTG-motif cell wall-anchored protein